jgi:hypothetical protein
VNKAVENHLSPVHYYEENWRNFFHNHNSFIFLRAKKHANLILKLYFVQYEENKHKRKGYTFF